MNGGAIQTSMRKVILLERSNESLAAEAHFFFLGYHLQLGIQFQFNSINLTQSIVGSHQRNPFRW